MNSLSEVFECFDKKMPMLELPVWDSTLPFGGSIVVNPRYIEYFKIEKRRSDESEPIIYITMQSGKEYQLAMTVQELGEKLIELGII